jgi:hypothetical protein
LDCSLSGNFNCRVNSLINICDIGFLKNGHLHCSACGCTLSYQLAMVEPVLNFHSIRVLHNQRHLSRGLMEDLSASREGSWTAPLGFSHISHRCPGDRESEIG